MPNVAAAVYGLEKSFAGVHALRNVTVELHAGQVRCLIGENGAGKSTLVKVLSGALSPDAGRVHIDGRPVHLGSPQGALRMGVRTIYQEHALVPALTVAENIALGYEPTRARVFRDPRRLRTLAVEALQRLGINDIDADTPVEQLGVARQQQLEIAKAVSREGGRLIIMDEPTAPLTQTETDSLFEIVRRLKAEGLAVLYVTHRLHELDVIADAVTVMRDGKVTWGGNVGERSNAELVETMVGRQINTLYPSRAPATTASDVAFRVVDTRASSRGQAIGKSGRPEITVRRGEIVGVFGLVGAGRTEMMRALIGLDPNDRYLVYLNGQEAYLSSPRAAMNAGISLVPEDRKRAGIVPDMDVTMNIGLSTLDTLGRGPWLRRKSLRRAASKYVTELAIRTPSIDQKISLLSGGTQQKCVVARVLARDPDVVVLDEPTRGIDVGARAELYRLINDLCAAGRAVLMITSDVAEALGMADRIYVMNQRQIVGELPGRTTTEEEVVGLALGEP